MRSSRTLLVFAASLSCLGSAAFADELNWIGNGADNDIATLENWDGTNGPPAAITTNDTLTYLYTGGSHETIAVTDSLDVAGLQVQVAPSDGTSPSILHSAGTLSITALSGEGIPTNTGILLLATENGSSGSYQMTGGSLSISGGKFSYFGDDGDGIGMVIGHNSGNGSFTLSGATTSLTSEARILVGSAGGTGAFTQTNGTVTTKGLIVGDGNFSGAASTAEGTVGTYEMNGGTLTVNTERFTVGRYGTGAFIQNGGTVNANGGLYIGDNAGTALDGVTAIRGDGTYELKNNGTLNVNGMIIGWLGTGTFTQTNGTVTNTGGMTIGDWSGNIGGTPYHGEGTYNIESGSLSVTGQTSVGTNGGNGTLNINGGTVTAGLVLVGTSSNSNSTGTINVNGGSATFSQAWIGDGGTGHLNITNATVTVNSRLNVGNHSNSTGTITVNNGGTLIGSGIWYIGHGQSTSTITVNTGGTISGSHEWRVGSNDGGDPGGTGYLNVNGGTATHTGSWFIVGSGSSTIGEVNLTSGSISSSASVNIGEGNNAQGTIKISGGTFTHTGTSFNIGRSANGTGTLEISGTGTLSSSASSFRLAQETSSTGTLKLGNGTAGGTLTVNQITSAAGSNSTFIFNGGKLVAGSNAVEAGDFLSANIQTLVVQDGGGIMDTNGKNIIFGRALTGTGDFTKMGTGTLTLKGDHTGYTGSLNVTGGNVAFAAGAELLFNVNGASSEADNVYTFANGSNVTLDTSVILQIALTNETSLFVGQTIDLFKGSSVNIANANLIQLLISNPEYSLVLNTSGQLLVTAIPEPSTYALFAAAGLLGLIAVRRRRKK